MDGDHFHFRGNCAILAIEKYWKIPVGPHGVFADAQAARPEITKKGEGVTARRRSSYER